MTAKLVAVLDTKLSSSSSSKISLAAFWAPDAGAFDALENGLRGCKVSIPPKAPSRARYPTRDDRKLPPVFERAKGLLFRPSKPAPAPPAPKLLLVVSANEAVDSLLLLEIFAESWVRPRRRGGSCT